MVGYVFFPETGKLPGPQDTAIKISTSAGTVIGQLLFGFLADFLGRKKVTRRAILLILDVRNRVDDYNGCDSWAHTLFEQRVNWRSRRHDFLACYSRDWCRRRLSDLIHYHQRIRHSQMAWRDDVFCLRKPRIRPIYRRSGKFHLYGRFQKLHSSQHLWRRLPNFTRQIVADHLRIRRCPCHFCAVFSAYYSRDYSVYTGRGKGCTVRCCRCGEIHQWQIWVSQTWYVAIFTGSGRPTEGQFPWLHQTLSQVEEWKSSSGNGRVVVLYGHSLCKTLVQFNLWYCSTDSVWILPSSWELSGIMVGETSMKS